MWVLGVDLDIFLSKQTKPKPNNFRAEEMIEWVKKPVVKPDSVSLILGTRGSRAPTPESCPSDFRVCWNTFALLPPHK